MVVFSESAIFYKFNDLCLLALPLFFDPACPLLPTARAEPSNNPGSIKITRAEAKAYGGFYKAGHRPVCLTSVC